MTKARGYALGATLLLLGACSDECRIDLPQKSPSYDEAVASLRESCSFFARVEVGTCGNTRYVETVAIEGAIDYYDSSGSLIGTVFSDDVADSKCPTIRAGVVPECAPMLVEKICPADHAPGRAAPR